MIVFVVNSASSYRMQRLLLEYLARDGRKACLLYTGTDRDFFAKVGATASGWGFPALAVESSLSEDEAAGDGTSDELMLPRSLRGWLALAALPLAERRRVAWAFRKATVARVARTLTLLRPLAIEGALCCEDGVSGDLAVLTAIRRCGIPLVDVPYGNGTSFEIEFDLAMKKEVGELHVPTGRHRLLLRLLGPHWLKRGGFEGAVLYRPEIVMGMLSLEVPVRDPWIVHGGMSDLLCVENEIGLEQYQREGIPEGKLRHTGSPYCDALVEGVVTSPRAQAVFRQPRRITTGRTRILVSWPPSYHDTYPGKSEFPDYATMTLHVLSSIKELPGVEMTISLHPACGAEIRDSLRIHGFDLSDDYVVRLIGQHDVFVTYFSSTIRWALAAGKPVVNYDAYALELPTFDEAPGFISTKRARALLDVLQTLVTSDERFSELATLQIAVADRWGIVDGRCCERVISETTSIGTAKRVH